MAEPFSIIAGAGGLADVCFRLTKILKQAKDGFHTVDADLEDLSTEITTLHSVNNLVQRTYQAEHGDTSDPSYQEILRGRWLPAQNALIACERVVEQIERLLTSIIGVSNEKNVKIDRLRKLLKQQSKEHELNTLRQQLNSNQHALQTSLTAIDIFYNQELRVASDGHHQKLSGSIQDLGKSLECKIDFLQTTLRESAKDPPAAQAKQPLNKHFYTPQTVSSIFTGRSTDLDVLNQHLILSSSTERRSAQKRFVIYGLSGSGKTQFCCKYASDNKESYWGVFWIDASSHEHAEQSFCSIAEVGKVAPNSLAAKNWLSNLGWERPWLLIIDNADGENIPVEDYFPDSCAGTIIITSRNPMLKVQGTIGPRYLEFEALREIESIELLLRAADMPAPWSQSLMDSARNIANALGHLPLALVHAGKTILARLCTFETYLTFLEKHWDKVPATDPNATIYSSYELLHDSLRAKNTQATEDALILLKVFCFLHRQRIRTDFFLRAARNRRIEELEQKRKELEDKRPNSIPKPKISWTQMLHKSIVSLYGVLVRLGSLDNTPPCLRCEVNEGVFDDSRLRQALKELFRMSLVTASDDMDDCYSMHPAVHSWVRKRPDMTLIERAVWCQMTATLLARAILLPPLADQQEDEVFRRDLLPHVRHVQELEQAIQVTFKHNLVSRQRLWPALQSRLDRGRALQHVKFSLILTQGGMLQEAEKLQSSVAAFAIQRLGIEHTATMDIMLLLSSTYWHLMRGAEATNLQKQVLEACIKTRGSEDLKTLKVMDAYGESQWREGQFPEARRIHETVVKGLEKVLGRDHLDTLRAKGNLGRAVGKDFRFDEAIDIHSQVLDGLKTKLDPFHSDIIHAMDNLALAYYDRAAFGFGRPEDLEYAKELEEEVFSIRTERLGKESLYTLWSGLNLARIKAALGETEDALEIFLAGHAIAKRNLGETHFGYLLGKVHHGRILICARRYVEAEEILSEVACQYKNSNRQGHPDHLLAMFSLIKCRNLLGKEDETLELLEELEEGTRSLYGADHLAMKCLLDSHQLSRRNTEDVSEQQESMGIDGGPKPVKSKTPKSMIATYGHI